MRAKLILATGSHAGIEAPLRTGYYMIGRHRECQIRPKTRKVSRRHCLVHNTDESVRVFDLGSSNGTFVNERRLEPNEWLTLADGDHLRCGCTQFQVEVEAQVAVVDESHVAQGSPATDSQDRALNVKADALQEFDIGQFLDEEDERERRQRMSAKTSRVWDPKSRKSDADDDANVLDDDVDRSTCPSGIHTDIDALGGDHDAHAVLERLRAGDQGGQDAYASLRAQRIAEIRARIEEQRKTQGRSRFKLKPADPSDAKNQDRSELFKYIAVGTLVGVSSLALMWSVYQVQHSTPIRVSDGLD
ncbi:hypothetical protein CKO51_32895 [Rhodopirellula sp. SM50]|nr:FHA domain-containing protein [Rhodopirellula sp. SM50]PAY15234.1 hypothetical protein CKO51_32895 [Rhodopirellula sp. SM50]